MWKVDGNGAAILEGNSGGFSCSRWAPLGRAPDAQSRRHSDSCLRILSRSAWSTAGSDPDLSWRLSGGSTGDAFPLLRVLPPFTPGSPWPSPHQGCWGMGLTRGTMVRVSCLTFCHVAGQEGEAESPYLLREVTPTWGVTQNWRTNGGFSSVCTWR